MLVILNNFDLFVPNTPYVGDGGKGGGKKIKVAQKCISVLKFFSGTPLAVILLSLSCLCHAQTRYTD